MDDRLCGVGRLPPFSARFESQKAGSLYVITGFSRHRRFIARAGVIGALRVAVRNSSIAHEDWSTEIAPFSSCGIYVQNGDWPRR
jgi:hypothetical protein